MIKLLKALFSMAIGAGMFLLLVFAFITILPYVAAVAAIGAIGYVLMWSAAEIFGKKEQPIPDPAPFLFDNHRDDIPTQEPYRFPK